VQFVGDGLIYVYHLHGRCTVLSSRLYLTRRKCQFLVRSQIVLQNVILKSGVMLSAWKSVQMPCQQI